MFKSATRARAHPELIWAVPNGQLYVDDAESIYRVYYANLGTVMCDVYEDEL